jgi:hypothetical protein
MKATVAVYGSKKWMGTITYLENLCISYRPVELNDGTGIHLNKSRL